jgi:hypothetical protein
MNGEVFRSFMISRVDQVSSAAFMLKPTASWPIYLLSNRCHQSRCLRQLKLPSLGAFGVGTLSQRLLLLRIRPMTNSGNFDRREDSRCSFFCTVKSCIHETAGSRFHFANIWQRTFSRASVAIRQLRAHYNIVEPEKFKGTQRTILIDIFTAAPSFIPISKIRTSWISAMNILASQYFRLVINYWEI